jgi:hypothetical protein
LAHLRGLQRHVLIRVDRDDHPERGQQRGQVLLADDAARVLTRLYHHPHTCLFLPVTLAIASEGYRRPGGQAGQSGHRAAGAFRT